MKPLSVNYLATFFTVFAVLTARAGNWPGWRGPDGTGVSAEKGLPLVWSTTENVRWHADLPGPGNSSPIVWGNRVFITQAVKSDNRRTVMCFDRANGRLLWQSGTTYTEQEPTQPNNPYCAATPVTDGERVIASFGSAGLYCYDFDGKEVWHRDLGKMNHMFGNGSSPILQGDLCILNFGPDEKARLIAVNKRDGKTVWEAQPPKVDPSEQQPMRGGPGGPGAPGGPGGPGGRGGPLPGSWSTPVVLRADGRDELILSFPYRLAACEPATGKPLWFSKGIGDSTYATPLLGEGTAIAMSGGPTGGIAVGVKPGGSGDVSESQRLWRQERFKSCIGSGVICDGHFYTIASDGMAGCYELKTGNKVWEERLKGPGAKGSSWSSMLLAEGRIYLPNQSGDVFVLRPSPKFEVLATNSVDEATNGSLAASDGEFFLRTDKSLWCFAAAKR